MKIVRESKSESFRIPISEYQWEAMCGKLPHVETLSNPDNYSLMYGEQKTDGCLKRYPLTTMHFRKPDPDFLSPIGSINVRRQIQLRGP